MGHRPGALLLLGPCVVPWVSQLTLISKFKTHLPAFKAWKEKRISSPNGQSWNQPGSLKQRHGVGGGAASLSSL